MQVLKTIPLLVIAGSIASCTSAGAVRLPSGPETIAAEKALALPPPGGPSIVSVVERKRGNGVEQTISLYTSSSVPGQNFLKVQFFGASGANPGTGNAPFRTVRDSELRREMAHAIPGVRMATSATFLQNSYGPFGYASGRSRAGDTCLYIWQQIRSSQAAHTQARNFGMIQVRLRLCDARASERQLLSIVYGYTITGSFEGDAWNPYGSPPPADPALGRVGSPIYPDNQGYRNAPISLGYEPAPTPSREEAVRHVATTAPPVRTDIEVPAGPQVPLPDGLDRPQADARSAPVVTRQALESGAVAVPLPD